MLEPEDVTFTVLSMELRAYFIAVRCWWWIPCSLALIGAVAGWIVAPAALYESRFRASVVMAGDTENPGSAERPELMILDDLLSLVESQAYAELTLNAIPADAREGITVAEIQDSLGESRYGRVATVSIQGPGRTEVERIAPAAASVFPQAVNTFLVAPGDQPANVQLLDSPSSPQKSTMRRWLTIGAIAFTLFAVGMWVIWLAGSMSEGRAALHHATQPDSPRSREAKNSSR